MSDSLDTLVQRVKKVTADFLKTAGQQIYVEVIDQMGEDIGAAAFRSGKSGTALSLRAPRNETDRLRFQTNRLGRALAPGEDGNINKLTIKGDQYTVEYGIDLSVVPYARIHEFGGSAGRGGAVKIKARPYLRPGFEAWLKLATPRYLRRIEKALEG
jgi:phage gpG-like protein